MTDAQSQTAQERAKVQERIEAKLKLLPDLPGCYLMKDAADQILYVGKAKNLKNLFPWRSRYQNYQTSVRNRPLRDHHHQ